MYWIKKNIIKSILLVFSIIFLYSIYFYNPEKDAKKAHENFCECSKQYNIELIKINKDFLEFFGKYKFTRRKDAREKIEKLQNELIFENSKCIKNAEEVFNELRDKYSKNPEAQEKFHLVYSKKDGSCKSIENDEATKIYLEIEKRIGLIIEPEPSIEKIKSDIIGQEILGWKFDYLNEFKSVEIINTTRGDNRIEYKIKFNLIDSNTNKTYESEVLIIYLQNEYGWNFSQISCNYIIYTYNIYPDRYTEIYTLKNCNWNAENNYKLSWKTSNWEYANEIITGPKEGNKTIPFSNVYYIKSLNGQEVKVKFTFSSSN
jgi:hypothetical protein